MLVLAALALQQAAAAPPQDRILELVLDEHDPLLDGHGACERVEHRPRFTGRLHVWAAAGDALDPFLRVEDAAGKRLAEDDDSGGKPTPYVQVDVEPDQALVVWVASAKPGGVGRLELHLVAAPESELTRQAAREADAAVGRARALARKRELPAARAEIAAAVRSLLATEGMHCAGGAITALSVLGGESWTLGDFESSLSARRAVVADLEHLMPPDRGVTQQARLQLVWTLRSSGRLAEALACGETVLAARMRTLPEDHPDVQSARLSAAWTARESGDLKRARELGQRALEVLTQHCKDDDPELQWARANVAQTLGLQGEFGAARALEEQVLAVRERTLPATHPDLVRARAELAWTLGRLGELERAQQLQEQVLELRAASLPEEHRDLQSARANLAVTLLQLGDARRARELQEHVLEVDLRTLHPLDRDLVVARENLALTLTVQGDVLRARLLLEQVVADEERRLPEDHPGRLSAQANLAQALRVMGDAPGARALLERIVAAQERILPEGDPALSSSIRLLAAVELDSGRPERAIELLRRLLEQQLRRLKPDHPDVLASRSLLGSAFLAAGDGEGARASFQEVLDARTRLDPPDSPNLPRARLNLGAALLALGQLEQGRALTEQVLAEEGRGLPRGSATFQLARRNLLQLELGPDQLARAEELGLQLARDARAALEQASLSLAPREAEGLVGQMRGRIRSVLDLALSAGASAREAELDAQAFLLVETARGIGLSSRYAQRGAERRDEFGGLASKLRGRIQAAAAEVSRAATSPAGTLHEFQDALRRKEAAERSLAEAVAASGLARELLPRPEPRTLAAALQEHEAALGFWVCGPRLVVALLARDASVRWIDLGQREQIAALVDRWRNAVSAPVPRGLGVGDRVARAAEEQAAGAALLQCIVAPLRALRPDARRWFIAPDDELHLVPFDALPEGPGVLGDRLEVIVLPALSALPRGEPRAPAAPVLLALGGIEFDRDPAVAVTDPALVRSGSWERGFSPLPETLQEVRAIDALFRKSFPEPVDAQRLELRAASARALVELAPRARFLHIATHGYYAPESIVSNGNAPASSKWVGTPLAFVEQVKGMSPWSLCGLALAGANQPPDALGRLQGVITAEELSALDLSRCELAVLSACETNVGVSRAGQGVASLQAALHAAGVRSAITSLWPVPDQATRELMVDFYRRIWVEQKPKAQALWEAKARLRDAKDEKGQPKYTTHDWGAWVLSGDPR